MNKEVQTYSIVGHDPDTKSWGVAVASKWLAVGNVVPHAQAGAGAIATQSFSNTSYGPRGLKLLAEGKGAQEVLNELLSSDPEAQKRQVGIIDSRGESATHTGTECNTPAGGVQGKWCVVQGNTLMSEEVLQTMKETFENAKGDLGHRLYDALLAGEQAGGDKRGKQSAALLVVKEGAGYAGFSDRFIDLRVDDHSEPVVELRRLLELHAQYHFIA
ncbi:DUF1028 domain-containing protein [Patescibacteria group bacterium]|nr:DUF1028 domain-containing protein [Patescibacteria group bacterium]